MLEREGVLWSREWREKNAQEKKSSSGSSDAVPTLSTVLSGELLGSSTSSAAAGGGDESHRSAHSTTTTAWRNKRLSVSLTLNTTKVDADADDDEFSLLKKFRDEDQQIEANAHHQGAEEAGGGGGEEGEPGGEELSEEKRMRAKLVRLEEMCVSRYRNVFHHMKGDVRKGIITLSEKPSYARRRKSRKSVRVVIIIVIRHVFLRDSPDSLDSLTHYDCLRRRSATCCCGPKDWPSRYDRFEPSAPSARDN